MGERRQQGEEQNRKCNAVHLKDDRIRLSVRIIENRRCNVRNLDFSKATTGRSGDSTARREYKCTTPFHAIGKLLNPPCSTWPNYGVSARLQSTFTKQCSSKRNIHLHCWILPNYDRILVYSQHAIITVVHMNCVHDFTFTVRVP